MNTQNKTYRALRELLYHEKGEMLKIDNTGYESLSFFYDSDDIEVMLQKGWIEEVKETPLVDQDGRFVEEPNEGEEYWYVLYLGNSEFIKKAEYLSIRDRNTLFKLGHCFISEEAAERFRDKQKLDVEIKRWIAKNDPDALKLDWKDSTERKYRFYYDFEEEKFHITYDYTSKNINHYYFYSNDKCHQCLKDIGEERVISLLVKT